MKGRERFFTIFTLGLLSAMGAFSIDMYLPGFPDIARDLHTTVAHITLSITSFFIGISIGQMIYGPLLDKFGRKKPLYIGLIVYLLTSIACAFAPTADALIGIRFLQALGSCAGMVASRALVRDIFPVGENAKIFSLLMLVLALSPIIAPTLGGYISSAFGWQFIFYILAVIAAITLLLVYFKLPAGRMPDASLSLLPRPIIAGFLEVSKVPQFYTYAFAGAIASSGLYAYIAGSPFVFMELYHVTEKQYGWIFAIIAMGLITASQVNTLLLRKYSSEQIIRATLFCQCLAGIALVLGSYFHFLGLYSTIFLIWVFLSTQGFAFPNSSALSLAPFTKNAGTASALMGAIQLGIGAVSTALVSIFNNGTAMPMAVVMCCCAVSSFVVLLIGRSVIAKVKNRELLT
ncbi:MAG TPA: multidrug effflux MFS transporter [Hanamia sp.]|jgi:MFS transporter, DHA1 family, multidrug resistance protein|nr:multidrug effflux MFS transporter [Hanamia sp.]